MFGDGLLGRTISLCKQSWCFFLLVCIQYLKNGPGLVLCVMLNNYLSVDKSGASAGEMFFFPRAIFEK